MSVRVGIIGRALLCVAAAWAAAAIWQWTSALHPARAEESQRAARVPASLKLAITIDDLPRSESLPPGYTSLLLLDELVATLRAHGVAHATGFVIGARVGADTTSRAALAAWTRAGHELGNHSYSHRSLDELGTDLYLSDIARTDPLLRELDRGAAPRSFRYPYLEEGRTPQQRAVLSRGIAQLGYTVARVSVDFSDWAWGDPYARCMARGDDAALQLLSQSYVQHASASLEWSIQAARQVLRRPLVHVLLLHANVATARTLDALLTEYERLGAQFVPLAEALSDPAYTAEYDGSGGNLLTLASVTTNRPLPPWQVRPLELLELVCR
jgi:peptidoglycan-N-acetylglucosamine deacetylase